MVSSWRVPYAEFECESICIAWFNHSLLQWLVRLLHINYREMRWGGSEARCYLCLQYQVNLINKYKTHCCIMFAYVYMDIWVRVGALNFIIAILSFRPINLRIWRLFVDRFRWQLAVCLSVLVWIERQRWQRQECLLHYSAFKILP